MLVMKIWNKYIRHVKTTNILVALQESLFLQMTSKDKFQNSKLKIIVRINIF